MKQYKGKIRWVYRHLPLSEIHKYAIAAAEASECAAEQGKFWPYHDLLFQNSPALDGKNLMQFARRVQIPNLKRFRACVATRRHRPLINKDLRAAGKIGFRGTPTFLIARRVENGMLEGEVLTGAQPLEAFAAIVDKLLGKKGR